MSLRLPIVSLVVLMLSARVVYAADAAGAEVDAKELFRVKCGVCHGPGGTGTFMLERRLGKGRGLLEERRDLDRALILHVARHGLQSMPAFSRAELPDSELQVIADYLTKREAR
jgi:mono/diheme cytochrome c family protein